MDPRMIAEQLGDSLRREEPPLPVEDLQHVLRANERMALTELGDARPHPGAIGWELLGDFGPRHLVYKARSREVERSRSHCRLLDSSPSRLLAFQHGEVLHLPV